jgi:hypothetical protein
MHTRRSLFDELSRYSVSSVDTRAENAFSVAVKFMALLREDCGEDEYVYDLMMKAWFRAVKDGDYQKFKRVYQKYKKGDPKN